MMDTDLSPSARNLTTKYEGVAIYFEEADSLEYVRDDVPVVHRRIDDMLTMVYDMRSREVIGFQVKGFRHAYLTDQKNGAPPLNFRSLVGFLERMATQLGGEFVDGQRRAAYERAHQIALEDSVELNDVPKFATARG